jgi:DNA-directed RNA polymerase subunit RPC12/RpoP
MICVKCGELFVADLENPKTKGLSLTQIAGKNVCPNCKTSLADSLKNYPDTFLGRNQQIGSFIPPTWIPPSEERKIIELWEIEISGER